MGIPRLWPLLSSCRRLQTLEDLSMDSFSSGTGYRALRLGIDTSMVMIMAEVHVRNEDGHTGYAPLSASQTNRALLLLFNFAVALLQIPTVLPVFVYDGSRRPSVKRGRAIKIWPFRLEHRFRSMCEGLGFEWMIATGEAEWEMASLAKMGWIDGCWTGDSDIFLTDSPLIVRLPLTFEPLSRLSTLQLEIYTRQSLASSPSSDCICLAILLGGDYSQGLFGPARSEPYVKLPLSIPQTLLRLSRSLYPGSTSSFTQTLLISAYAPVGTRETLLAQWSKNVLSSPLLRSHSLIVPPDWPSLLSLSSYLNPLVTPSADLTPLKWTPPDIEKIIDTLLDTLTLVPSEIVDMFEQDGGIWEGMVRGWMRREGLRRTRGGWVDLKVDELGLDLEVTGRGAVRVDVVVWRGVLRTYLGEAVEMEVELGDRWDGWRTVEVREELIEFLNGDKKREEKKKSFNPIDTIVLD